MTTKEKEMILNFIENLSPRIEQIEKRAKGESYPQEYINLNLSEIEWVKLTIKNYIRTIPDNKTTVIEDNSLIKISEVLDMIDEIILAGDTTYASHHIGVLAWYKALSTLKQKLTPTKKRECCGQRIENETK